MLVEQSNIEIVVTIKTNIYWHPYTEGTTLMNRIPSAGKVSDIHTYIELKKTAQILSNNTDFSRIDL